MQHALQSARRSAVKSLSEALGGMSRAASQHSTNTRAGTFARVCRTHDLATLAQSLGATEDHTAAGLNGDRTRCMTYAIRPPLQDALTRTDRVYRVVVRT
jgi:hypothetical protein